MTISPEKVWWTASEIAAARMPELPNSQKGVDVLAKRLGWRSHPTFARRRSGRGGGWEYHWQLFPLAAQKKLLAHAKSAEPVAPAVAADRDEAWTWYESLPQSVKDKALLRLRVIQQVEALEGNLGRYLAVDQVARLSKCGERTIWNWLDRIEGIRRDDRLPYLAPRHRAAQPRIRTKQCDAEFMDLLKSDFLRLSGPSFASCYRRQLRVAQERGLQTLPPKTAQRRLNATVSPMTQLLARKGIEAVKRRYPTQRRDKTALHALEAVNADFHKFDVFVRWPAERGVPSFVGRPQMVAFQDIYSGRILSWRLDQTPNSTAVLLAAGDMIEDWGIPGHVLLDNGREFAAKVVTGGAATRYRFKVKEDDVPGLFVALGCEIHWATPYSGQSKPIERAFRDMCDTIAKDPRFDGAWTGNRPEAKPEDYGSRAIDLEDFLRVLAEGIEEHNTRQGRRSEIAYGRSFADVFDESYANSPIRKATEAQRRLWLLGAEGLRVNRKGEIAFQNNVYWSRWLLDHAEQAVVARFDPADLWSGLHVYSHDGAYLGQAPATDRSGFFDMEEARIMARTRRGWLKAEKRAADAHRVYTAAELGRRLDEVSPVEPPPPEAKVIRLAKPASRKAADPAPRETGAPSGTVTTLPIRGPAPAEEAPRARFKRALELERAMERGEEITREQRKWLSGYQTSSEYRAEQMLWRDFGDAIFG
ncbi:Mu DNA-binding domain-containing protein [[Luteovulum] sphaeroides subsp. megalophilum]|uniref:transposase domain-containing protein n=1 Tax=Cereibacter sphaeroides TaxID=1063 RepID=UPI000B681CDB|nr:transposase domain-containing protein [Cereibacter sphaeroides]SNS87360.1 Mu DNA-binding domain-containing protein [[Luteovulum] sphaeroides subsp. megalophilum]